MTLNKLNEAYRTMKGQLSTAQVDTLPALAEARTLLERRRQVERKCEIIGKLRSHFMLSAAETLALTSSAEPVNDDFFSALGRGKQMLRDCEALLGFERQTLGSELMELTSNHINLGYQKLYNWTQREFKGLDLENPQMSATIRRALKVLAERPSLFQSCLNSFSEARQRVLSDAFFSALTGSRPDGPDVPAAKPIDMTAHDPIRYAGDMLAWVHSAAVSEREVLEVLFVAEGEELAKGLSDGRDAEVWRLVDEEGKEEFNATKALDSLVDRDVSGATRILRQRIEQVIQANEDDILAYRLSSLLKFYGVMLRKLLGPDCNLLEAIESMEGECMRQFKTLLRERIAIVHGDSFQIPSNLAPPLFLQDALKQLEVIISTYETSLSSSNDEPEEVHELIEEAFDPFLLGCEELAKSLPSPDDSIFLLNCWLAGSKCLSQRDVTSYRKSQLESSVEVQGETLMQLQLEFLRQESGLSALFSALDMAETQRNNTITASSLAAPSQTLDKFLPSAHMDAMERLENLQDTLLARKITKEAADLFCQEFERLETYIDAHDKTLDAGQRPGLRAVFPRTSGEIRVLLS